ncbi:MAG: hypothetical protein KBD25_06425 [Rickettsiaceae bacterium]|nr:hypothetical protein [Rickettsiaceae bacterium]
MAISQQTKTVEVRANKISNGVNYGAIKKGDKIIFTSANVSLLCSVKQVNYYKNLVELFSNEDASKVLSSKKTIDEGIELIEAISDYKQVIRKNGVFAIHIKPIIRSRKNTN